MFSKHATLKALAVAAGLAQVEPLTVAEQAAECLRFAHKRAATSETIQERLARRIECVARDRGQQFARDVQFECLRRVRRRFANA